MQVQRVQNNTQPHFTNMSLIVRKIPKEQITTSFVDTCERAKKILDGTPKSNIDVKVIIDGKGLIPRIVTGTADNYSTFYTPIEPNRITPEFLRVKTMNHPYSDIDKWEVGVEREAVYKLSSATEAYAYYNRMINAKSNIEKAALFARAIYESMVRRAEESINAAEMAARNQARLSTIVDELTTC